MANEHMRILLFAVIACTSFYSGAMEESRCLSKAELRQIEKESLEIKMKQYAEAPRNLMLSWSERLAELTKKEAKVKAKKETLDVLLANNGRSRSRQEEKPQPHNLTGKSLPSTNKNSGYCEEENRLDDENSGAQDDQNPAMGRSSENCLEKPKPPTALWFAQLFSFSWWWPATIHLSAKLLNGTFWKTTSYGGQAIKGR